MKINGKVIFFFLITFITTFLFFNGCGKKEDDVIKIGVTLPLSGDIAVYGQSTKNGIEIALSETNFMLKEKRIEVIYEDERGTTKDGVNSIKKLIETDKVNVILGGISSSVALAMAPIAEQNKVVLMCPFASSPKITNAGDYIFRIMPSDAFQGQLLPEWLMNKNYSKVAIVAVKNDWGQALKDAFKQKYLSLGGKIILEEDCDENSKDVRNIVTKVKTVEKQVDALFLPTYPEVASILLKQLKEMKIKLPVFGGDTWANNLLIDLTGKSSEGVMFLAPMQYEGDEYQSFKKKYYQKFNKEPDLPASAGYDAMKVVLFSIKNLMDKNVEISGENLKNELYKVKDFNGATGTTTFDANGDVVSKFFAKRIVKNGKFVSYE